MSSSRFSGPTDLTGFLVERANDSRQSHRFERSSRSQDQPSALDVRRKPGWTVPSRPQFALTFLAYGPPRVGLTEQDYRSAAAILGVEIDTFKNVAEAAIGGAAFDAQGRPAMHFESHHFQRYTRGRFDNSHPAVSNPVSHSRDDRETSPSSEYDKLQEAYDLNTVAALKSAAWGRFQVLGSSHRAVGCATVNEFVLAMVQSEAAHLNAFVSVIQSNDALLEALRANDRAGFAMRYKG
jgi:hypothetical protein